MSERFDTTVRFQSPSDAVLLQPAYVVVEDTGSADSLNTVRHNLGRIPRGYRIIKSWFGSTPSAPFSAYKLTADNNDTDTFIYVRFTADNARVALEIF